MAQLTGITLRNFKAVGDAPVHLELAPVTLLYGPNGAGKSSILHALHYAREVLERSNLDPDRTLAGGALDLGGWRALVHQRDVERDMVLGFDLQLDGRGLPDFGGINDERDDLSEFGYVEAGALADLRTIDSAGVELTLAWRPGRSPRPYVKRWSVSLEGKRFAAIESSPDLLSIMLTDLNEQHPVLNRENGTRDLEEPRGWSFAEALFRGKRVPLIGIYNTRGALPHLYEPLQLDLDIDAVERVAGAAEDYPNGDMPGEYVDDMKRERRLNAALEIYVSRILVGAGIALRDALSTMVAIGPLRELPPRGFQPQRSPDPARWTSGLAAWDRLAELDDETVAEVDAWMSGETRLGSGFGVRVERFRRVATASAFAELMARGLTPLDVADLARLWIEIPEKRHITLRDVARRIDVEPADIGVGVSQLLPVVVAALDHSTRFLAVEQPELHVHPRLQTGLGDLFAFGVAPVGEQTALFDDIPAKAIPNGRTFLIETHSEHLALRLLRRIREANEGEADPDAPTVTPAMLSINYALPGEEGLTLVRLHVDETGEFVERWPEGFFAERRAELF